jgi:hypothetical protein
MESFSPHREMGLICFGGTLISVDVLDLTCVWWTTIEGRSCWSYVTDQLHFYHQLLLLRLFEHLEQEGDAAKQQ